VRPRRCLQLLLSRTVLHLGKGVAQDDERALRVFESSCKDGYVRSCGVLGEMYLEGQGTGVNAVKALANFEKSCAGRWGQSCEAAAMLYHRGRRGRRTKRSRRSDSSKGANSAIGLRADFWRTPRLGIRSRARASRQGTAPAEVAPYFKAEFSRNPRSRSDPQRPRHRPITLEIPCARKALIPMGFCPMENKGRRALISPPQGAKQDGVSKVPQPEDAPDQEGGPPANELLPLFGFFLVLLPLQDRAMAEETHRARERPAPVMDYQDAAGSAQSQLPE